MEPIYFFLSPEGRINRGQYWLGCLGLFVIYLLIVGLLSGNSSGVPDSNIVTFAIIVLIWPGMVLQIKRWHDRDKSGWWIFLTIIPIVGSIWTFFELGLGEGTKGPNRYGG